MGRRKPGQRGLHPHRQPCEAGSFSQKNAAASDPVQDQTKKSSYSSNLEIRRCPAQGQQRRSNLDEGRGFEVAITT